MEKNGLEKLRTELAEYTPWNEQEEKDRDVILSYINRFPNAFDRSNLIAHITASSWVINRKRDQVLLVYHNIYDSWSWTGGHADGETDLLSVAIREVREETGVKSVKPVSDKIFSLEVLTVDGHEKWGQYVPSHLHLNITYLLEANETEELRVCEGENKAVSWFPPEDALSASSEPWFVQRIYKKLNEKMRTF
ncbi:MAG: NUDIX hydrolase [Eubacteriales bacterium]|nr:NUDIX hydrolase [Eubacteriales bacterium]